jgi:hypothetical protein
MRAMSRKRAKEVPSLDASREGDGTEPVNLHNRIPTDAGVGTNLIDGFGLNLRRGQIIRLFTPWEIR